MSTEPIEAELTSEESDLSVNFYDAAVDFPGDGFSQTAKRVLGARDFADFPHAVASQAECKKHFDLARD